MPIDPRDILRHLATGAPLAPAQGEEFFEAILEGQFDDAQFAAALSMIMLRGPTVDELVAGVRVLRRRAIGVPMERIRRADGSMPAILDTCGTGGAPKTFNISTAAAIVSAAAGRGRLVVAKHGGRSRTGRGSAEVLAQLGVNIDATPEAQARCLAEAGVCFSFAVNHHPAMRHAAAVRRSLGFPTIINLMGPLANPAGATRQVIGTFSPVHAATMAAALSRLGAERAFVVTSLDGMDELTTTSANIVHDVRDGTVSETELDASTLGLRRAARGEIEASSLEGSAGMIRELLAGRAGGPRDVVALNAGAALVVCDAAPDLGAGVAMALEAIDSGEAGRTLAALVRLSQGG